MFGFLTVLFPTGFFNSFEWLWLCSFHTGRSRNIWTLKLFLPPPLVLTPVYGGGRFKQRGYLMADFLPPTLDSLSTPV